VRSGALAVSRATIPLVYYDKAEFAQATSHRTAAQSNFGRITSDPYRFADTIWQSRPTVLYESPATV